MIANTLVLALAALTPAPEAPTPEAGRPIACVGGHSQGSLLICRTEPGAAVRLGEARAVADAGGYVVLGHDRDAPAETDMAVAPQAALADSNLSWTVQVAQREYDIQRIDGLAPQFVTPPDEVLERIRAEGAQKRAAYESLWQGAGFLTGFVMPLEGRITGVYGSQRFYNDEPRRPHYGIDIAASAGTPVRAPAGGIVTLAEADMYFEGGLIFIDHGQGLTSAFLHLSEIEVAVGDEVAQGDVIGAVGSGGRSTGAHLDWRMKWRDRYIDPGLALAVDPAPLR